ncbi:MAG: DUF58 domain-containing protein [Planctomycetia bacterium]|nr:DUF58 domain-containing protein [Planctomycetia bacterium]
MALRDLFSWRRTTPDKAAARDTRSASAVHVSSEELIRLRLQARDLRLDRRQAARSVISGAHSSRFRGRGMDYLESRGYQPGDDIRNMDWRVTARSGHAHVKVYQEERERPVVVMIDLGPGMFFATQGAFKSVIAARAAALIGWAAVRNGDRIGALLFNGGHHELRPLGGQRGVLRLIRELIPATDPANAARTHSDSNHLNDALVRLRRVARPGSLVFILSDFYAIDADTRRHLQQLRRHNDVVACQIIDTLEMTPPPAGRYAISDGTHSGTLDTRTTARRRAWENYFSEHHHAVRELMMKCAVPLLRLTTSDDVAERLRNMTNTLPVGAGLPANNGVPVATIRGQARSYGPGDNRGDAA